MQQQIDVQDVIADGGWLAHRYDETHDTVHFVRLSREDHRRITFLTDSEIGEAPRVVLARAECLAAAKALASPTPRFIFHSAYCCSTLLARAFDLPGTAMGIKEPQILNDVVGLRLRGGGPRQVAAALDIALWLLARPLASGEISVIKPSNLVNPMIPAIFAMRPDARALLLHAPLAAFLGSVARKEIEGRAWVRELMWQLIRLGQTERFGFSQEDLYRQTDLQVAALGWLAQNALFADLIAKHGQQLRTIDSETLTARPAESIEALGGLFQIDLDAEAVAAGPAFNEHSKDRGAYGAAERVAERESGLAIHAREIAMVLEWSRAVADHAAVPCDLPAPLLS
jgi:hypothetical protein